MSMVTAMDGIGDVNHVDTVHDNISEEYKQTMEKAIENKEIQPERVEEYFKLQRESKYNTNTDEYLMKKRDKFKAISKVNKHRRK